MGRELFKSPALRLTSTLAPTTSETAGSVSEVTEIRSVIHDPIFVVRLTWMKASRFAESPAFRTGVWYVPATTAAVTLVEPDQ